MKIEIESADLLALVQAAHKAAATRAVNPVLAGVKLVAEGGSLTAAGTDLEIASSQTARCEVLRAGACVVMQPGKLASVLKEHGGVAALSADDGPLRVRVSGGRYDLPTGEADQFPDFPECPEKVRGHEYATATADAAALLRAILVTVEAASRRDNNPRYSAHSVLFEVTGGTLSLVATDTRRVHHAEVGAAAGDWPGGVLVPVRAVRLLADRLKGWAGEVAVAASATEVRFAAGTSRLWSRQVAGRFPQWRQFVPGQFETRMPLDLAAFAVHARQAAITCDAESRRVDFAFSPGRVVMAGRGAEAGASEVEMAVPGCESEFDIAFDPQYVHDAATAFLESGADGCTFSYGGPGKPGLFRWDGGLALVMPMGDRE